MMYFKGKTIEQNGLINAIRENVRDYVKTLDDPEEQIKIIIDFKTFLMDSLQAEWEPYFFAVWNEEGEEVEAPLGDSIDAEFNGICMLAGLQKALEESTD